MIMVLKNQKLKAAIDDPQIYDGAYVGLQIIGRRLQEEKVLQLARIVSEALAKQGSIR